MPARPSRPGDLDAVDIGLVDAGKAADDLGDLGGRDVLALPAERVADAVDEIEIAVGVLAHEIAGAEPGIALLEHVAQNLRRVVGGVGIAFEPHVGFGRIGENLPDRFADLAGRSTARRSPFALRIGCALLDVEFHEAIGKRRLRNQGMRPTAPGRPSKLNRFTLPSVAA